MHALPRKPCSNVGGAEVVHVVAVYRRKLDINVQLVLSSLIKYINIQLPYLSIKRHILNLLWQHFLHSSIDNPCSWCIVCSCATNSNLPNPSLNQAIPSFRLSCNTTRTLQVTLNLFKIINHTGSLSFTVWHGKAKNNIPSNTVKSCSPLLRASIMYKLSLHMYSS